MVPASFPFCLRDRSSSAAFSGEVWTEEALDVFEQLTHCASWRPLQAKLCSYSHSEISSWPSVKLYDSRDGQVRLFLLFTASACFQNHSQTCAPQALDVGEELIRLGHAVGHQEVLNTSAEGGNRGSLQQMLVGPFNFLSLTGGV